MNPAHLHLLVNHLPVIGSLCTFLLMLYATIRRSDELRRAAMIAMVLVAFSAVPAYLSGEPAEKRIEHAPGVTEEVIAPHEASAKISLTGVLILGVLALYGLLASRGRPAPGWLAMALLVLNLLVAAQLGVTANRGGQIRHLEIRPGSGAEAKDPSPG